MRYVLMIIAVATIGILSCGCEENAKSGSSLTTKPPVVEESEPQKPDIQRGLIGWWKFDETAGKTAADSSPKNRPGAIKGDVTFDSASQPGRIGKALRLGKKDYVEITGYKGILGTKPRTVSAWIKTKSTKGKLISWGVDEGGGMFNFCFIRSRVGVTVGVTLDSGYLFMNTKSSDDKWHHVAAVVEEAELPNLHDHVKLFKDGEISEIHDIGLLDLFPIDTPSGMDVRIGDGHEGIIDDVRIYDRALSEEEIELLFESTE